MQQSVSYNDQLEQNQVALREEVSQVRAQMGKLMETIKSFTRGQEIMAKIQSEMNQRAHVAVTTIPTTIPTIVEDIMPPQGNTPVQITVGEPGGVSPPVIHPPVIKIDDQQDVFFSPRVTFIYEAFGLPANEVENKAQAIEEKLKAMEVSNKIGIDAAKMCLVSGIVILAKFEVPDFEKYKWAGDPRTNVRAYCRDMAAYSDDDKLLMHFFEDSLSWASLDWYMQLEGTNIRSLRDMDEAFLKHYQYNTDMAPNRTNCKI